MRAEVVADNASIRVSWEWSCQGVPDNVTVDYRPEGGSLMMFTVDNTTATSATLRNLQCNTEYTIWVHASDGLNDSRSLPIMVSLGRDLQRNLFFYSSYKFVLLYHPSSEVTAQLGLTAWVVQLSEYSMAVE